MTEGVRVEPVAGWPRVRVERGAIARTGAQEAAIASAWDAMCARNPRYFNGRILSFESYDAAAGVAVARDAAYRDHACRGAVDLGIAFFGITGVLCVGEGAARRFFVARRGDSVHEYPGQWEFGPCGGIDPPAEGDELGAEELLAELRREAMEELGIALDTRGARALALVHDDPVGSTDLMVLVPLGHEPVADRNWEYSQTRWATLGEIVDWAGPGDVIPTTRALAAWMAGAGV